MAPTRLRLPDAEEFEAQAQLCQALVDAKRLRILYLLREGERSVGELVEATGMRQTNASQHLATLRELGLVRARREANFVYYSLAAPKILQACDLIQRLLHELNRR